MTLTQPSNESGTWRADLRKQLLRWFDRNARDLPWRRDPTPYHVWVSEIMLQQTQVATVISYYERFLRAFPDVQTLASADESSLMRIWEGLGYYRRARLMHQAAKEVVEHHNGIFPTDFANVLALPGIGRYTAGAILSISCDAKLPILEGNTVRVFSRWLAMQHDVKSSQGISELWEFAESMLPKKGSGKFNQAAMELGALLCKPVSPQCDVCPVASHCQASIQGLQESIPGKVTRMKYEDRREFAFIIPDRSEQSVLIYRVPTGERWAGLWDFPRVLDGQARHSDEAAKMVSLRTGLSVEPKAKVATIKHAVTRFRITLDVHRASPVEHGDLLPTAGDFRFATIAELAELPLSTTGRKIATFLAK